MTDTERYGAEGFPTRCCLYDLKGGNGTNVNRNIIGCSLCSTWSFNPRTVVCSRSVLRSTRLFSTLYSNDLMILTVIVADVLGRIVFVRSLDIR
jgi:hypothetical protein